MEKYEPMGVVGEGSYGIVLKCKSRHDGKVVAIKKFIDSEDDVNVRKIAMREIRVLKKLRHENLVSLIEVFRRRKHLYLVFEFIDHTLLDQMEQKNQGLDPETCRKYIFQILRGLGFCHDNSVIHRDIKPENVLVSKNGIVKLCDFGFARNLSGPGDIYTDYVATRWYRAPELLVGDVAYGKEVDIWAVGCLFAEMMTGEPLFPGDSDIDQLFLIAQCLGRLSKRHLSIMSKNSAFRGFQFPKSRHGSTTSVGSTKFTSKMNDGTTAGKSGRNSGAYSSHMNASSSGRNRNVNNAESNSEPVRSVFSVLFPSWSEEAVYFLTVCLDPEPNARPTCNSLMRMPYFSHDNFPARFLAELNSKLQLEGRQTTASHHIVRKRRSLVPTGNVGAVFPGFRTGGGGPNVTSTIITPAERSSIFPNSRNASMEDNTQQKLNNPRPFQSNNLSNQTQFSNSTNLSRQQTFLVSQAAKNPLPPTNLKKIPPDQSRIPVLLHRKSSEESFPINSNPGVSKAISPEEIPNNKEKRQTPKKFSFSVNQPETGAMSELKGQQPGLGHLPVTTLTFNLGPHNMTYNGTTYSTSTAPTPLKSPGIGSSTTNAFSTSTGSRSSPGRNRKKVGGLGIGTIGQTQGSNYFPHNTNYAGGNNPRSLPLGVSVFGAPILKNDGNAWNGPGTMGGNGEASFLPRVTSKHQSSNVSFDENTTPLAALGSPSKPGTGVNPLGRKREKWDQPGQPSFQNRKASISNSSDLGNIRAFLNPNTNEGTEPSTPVKGNQFKF